MIYNIIYVYDLRYRKKDDVTVIEHTLLDYSFRVSKNIVSRITIICCLNNDIFGSKDLRPIIDMGVVT